MGVELVKCGVEVGVEVGREGGDWMGIDGVLGLR